MKQISLFFKEGTSDKEYHVQLEPKGSGFVVNFQYGRRGSTLTAGTKTPAPVPQAKAESIYEKLVQEKMAKGYTQGASGTPYVGTAKEDRATGNIPQLLNPITEDEVEQYLSDPDWGAQEKKDGKHIMVTVKDEVVVASNRKGLQVGIPEPIAKALKGFVVELDGEMIGDVYHVFDCLSSYKLSFRASPYKTRYSQLAGLVGVSDAIKVVPLAATEKEKRDLYARLKKEGREGIVFKKLDATYTPGRPSSGGNMLKHKFYATCSCEVVEGREGKRSIGLELNKINGPRDIETFFVGNVTVPANQPIPKVGDIVEIRYLYAYKGGSLYQPVLLGVRDDLEAHDCTIDQLKYKAEEE